MNDSELNDPYQQSSTLVSLDPATNQTNNTYRYWDSGQCEAALEIAHDSQQVWQKTTFPQRAEKLRNIAIHLLAQREHYATLITQEMGKPIREARSEIEKCAAVCNYYAQHAEAFLRDEPITSDAAKSYVAYPPLGTVLAIMPWNFPFWQVFRAAAPALMAGNALVLKHAPNLPRCAIALAGCNPVDRDGCFYQPSILDHVTPETPAYHEELFGPVACIIRATDEQDALRIANETQFGLGSSIWSKDTVRAEHLAAQIQAGCTFINGMVKSDPGLPFGGVKSSGYGRELSRLGIHEFVYAKTVWIR